MLATIVAFAIGIVGGLRPGVPLMAITWAAYFKPLKESGPVTEIFLEPVRLSFAWFLTVVALIDIVADKHPKSPKQLTVWRFLPGLITGGCGGAIIAELAGLHTLLGASLGIAGSINGTYARHRIRALFVMKLTRTKMLMSLLVDAVAIALALLIVSNLEKILI